MARSRIALAVAALCWTSPAAAGVVSLTLSCTAGCSGTAAAGSSVWLTWTATTNDSSYAFWVFPYVNGGQWGAEAAPLAASGNTVSGTFALPLPVAVSGAVALSVAVHPIPQGPSIGLPPPGGAVVSNSVTVTVASLAPGVNRRVAGGAGSPTVGLYFESWFTPLNFYWQGGVSGGRGAGGGGGDGVADVADECHAPLLADRVVGGHPLCRPVRQL